MVLWGQGSMEYKTTNVDLVPYHLSPEDQNALQVVAEEFIFTESHGAVGSVMASAEWSFGTICQYRT